MKKTKKYVKNMNDEEIKKVLAKNNKLQESIARNIYEDQMFCQEQEGNNIFGKDWYNYIDLKDCYSSFYLTLTSWQKFIDNLDKDYLSPEQEKKYNYIKNKKWILDNMELFTDNYYNLYNHLEEKSKELLKDIENYLHTYENYPSDDNILDHLKEDINESYQDCYIIPEDNNYILYEDISYTKNYE